MHVSPKSELPGDNQIGVLLHAEEALREAQERPGDEGHHPDEGQVVVVERQPHPHDVPRMHVHVPHAKREHRQRAPKGRRHGLIPDASDFLSKE